VIAWIRVDGGEVFEGTPEQFDDSFGGVFFTSDGRDAPIQRTDDKTAMEIVQHWAKRDGYTVEFLEEVPPEFRKGTG
jgi:hypothetical protein